MTLSVGLCLIFYSVGPLYRENPRFELNSHPDILSVPIVSISFPSTSLSDGDGLNKIKTTTYYRENILTYDIGPLLLLLTCY